MGKETQERILKFMESSPYGATEREMSSTLKITHFTFARNIWSLIIDKKILCAKKGRTRVFFVRKPYSSKPKEYEREANKIECHRYYIWID